MNIGLCCTFVSNGWQFIHDISDDQEPPSSPQARQAQLLQNQLSPHELAYQESLIQEREGDIREIETGIHELAEIFRDLGTLVHEQGGMLGRYIYILPGSFS
jgi:hypothetical protein